jgi:hypothetical protein
MLIKILYSGTSGCRSKKYLADVMSNGDRFASLHLLQAEYRLAFLRAPRRYRRN